MSSSSARKASIANRDRKWRASPRKRPAPSFNDKATPKTQSGRHAGARLPADSDGLGSKVPSPALFHELAEDIGFKGKHFHFCKDSDVLVAESPDAVKAMAKDQTSESEFLVHGYASTGRRPGLQ